MGGCLSDMDAGSESGPTAPGQPVLAGRFHRDQGQAIFPRGAATGIVRPWTACSTRRAERTGSSGWPVRGTRGSLADEVVGHAFRHGTQPDHIERLAAYWAEALGGPDVYTKHIRRRDLGRADPQRQREHEEMDRRAIACFDRPSRTPGSRPTRPCARRCTTTSPGRQRPRWRVSPIARRRPRRPPIPRWSWDGPQPDG